jgi:glutamyl-Q tRNA(Asp) synthetase
MTDAAPPAYRGRFAPSPTGPLHLGSLLAAWASWLLARQARGEWLVRVEDLDPPREVAGSADAQLDVLSAFGLESDAPVIRQSQRGPFYQAALDRLLASGDAFPCHCSRAALATDGGIHRHCVAGAHRSDPAIRFRVPASATLHLDDLVQGPVEQDIAQAVGDFVLKRADGLWAYQLAVVVDDAAQGITDVVRGADLLDSTPRQILLQRALGLPTPRYAHLPVLLAADGRKLSKSLASLPVDATDPLPALRFLWETMGQPRRALARAGSLPMLLATAEREFDLSLVPKVVAAPVTRRNIGVTSGP